MNTKEWSEEFDGFLPLSVDERPDIISEEISSVETI